MITNSLPYKIIEPKGIKKPFILSIPHSGTLFPEELKDSYNPSLAKLPDDTDWHLDKLYDFASEMGVTVIQAVYSRWVIDLNRDPENTALYNDGRIITSLCPVTDFLGNPIYNSQQNEPDQEEVERRKDTYFWPYHRKINELIQTIKFEFNQVLFWDAHSIRRNVKTIRKESFPDLILGNNDLKTAGTNYIDIALKQLGSNDYQLQHNYPFKGGYLTRSIGNPSQNIHALQLEMSKDLYLSNNETTYDHKKAEKIKSILKQTFQHLIDELT